MVFEYGFMCSRHWIVIICKIYIYLGYVILGFSNDFTIRNTLPLIQVFDRAKEILGSRNSVEQTSIIFKIENITYLI